MLTKTASLFLRPVQKCWMNDLIIQALPFKFLQKGSLTVQLGQDTYRFGQKGTGVHAELTLHNPFQFLLKVWTDGEFGFVEAYANQWIETSCLHSLLRLGADNESFLSKALKGKPRFYDKYLKKHRENHNSIENSRQNISAHYDLGNAFYQLWLDPTMSYSSALFSEKNQDLVSAQQAKYQRILHEIDLQAGDQILEIGCGWGGFAEQAAQQGAHVHGITLSREQLSFARQRMIAQRLDHKTELTLTDYRHQDGLFDHIVSIEMFEAVGKEYWADYFTQLKRLLKSDGKAVLQIITIDEAYADSYQNQVDFIQAYIFPGGLLPSKTQLAQLASEHGFKITNTLSFGLDYAETLLRWKQAFNQHSQKLKGLGYDARFQRLWNYYLDYCRVGFETQRTDVIQLTLEPSKV
jgi:cyclopropane-fatty-acyl-phospholipid synthase